MKLFEKMEEIIALNNSSTPTAQEYFKDINILRIEEGTEYEGTILDNLLCKMKNDSTFNITAQQDSQDFLNSILGCFKDYILNEPLIEYINELFYFKNIDSYECINGKNLLKDKTINNITKSDTSGAILTLALDSFVDGTRITELIDKYQEKENFTFPYFPIISDSADTHESCGPPEVYKDSAGIIQYDTNGIPNRHNATSKQILVKIQDEQKYILIMLKRFKKNPLDNKNPTKISTSIDFEKELTIDNKKFKILGILRHGGDTLLGGHYRYEIFDKDLKPYKILDDKRVLDSLLVENLKEKREIQAYVLLYQRTDIIPPIVVPPPVVVLPSSTLTNLNGKSLKYLQIPIKAKRGEKSIITNLQESINKTDKKKIFIGCDKTGTDILKNDKADKQFDDLTDIARLIRSGNEHISFSTFKINDNYEKNLKNFKLSEVRLSQLTFKFNSIKYLPNPADKKKFIVEILDMTGANVNDLINTTIPNKIMELTGLTGLTGLKKNTYTLNGKKWTSTDTAIKDKTITIDLNNNNFSSNVSSIDSYCDNEGNEMIRFYNYDPIELHITLSQQQKTPPKPAKLTPEDIGKFNQALEYLKEKIEPVFTANKSLSVPLIFDNTTDFEFSKSYIHTPLAPKFSKAP